MLSFNSKFEILAYVSPLCLPLSQRLRNKDYTGEELTVTGWGQTDAKNRSDVKLKVKVMIILFMTFSQYIANHILVLILGTSETEA